jgi:hypothetical protein
MEVGDEYLQNVSRGTLAGYIVSDRWLEGTRATDGTDIGSRRKTREYMQRNNLAHYDEIAPDIARAQREQAQAATVERQMDVVLAIDQLGRRR